MSGDSIAYQLRPNKHIDRQIFIDFIKLLGTQKPLPSYEYISMGGPFLEDATAIYRETGIEKITSFEAEKHVLERQLFNRPFSFIECLGQTSEEFIEAFPEHSSIKNADGNFIVWLDYADSGKRLAQLQELEKLLVKMESWDVVRITMNANAVTLGTKVDDGDTDIKQTRLRKLRSVLGGSYPCDAQETDMVQKKFPNILARIIGIAAERAMKGRKNVYPVSVCSYADGNHTMLTVTMIVLTQNEWKHFSQALQASEWPYMASGWEDIEKISIPALSQKEKISIDGGLKSKTAEEILDETGVVFSSSREAMLETLETYIRVHRFYPNFVRADL